VTRLALIGLIAAVAACGKFQDPNVVVDLRVLAIDADPADQLVDVDLTKRIDPLEILGQLVPTKVCALVADPVQDRRLVWSMRLCQYGDGERCDEDSAYPIANGTIDDPDTTMPEPQLCATVMPDQNLLGVYLGALKGDTLQGLGGVDAELELRVGGELDVRSDDEFVAKDMRISPRIPTTRVPNQNPYLDHIDAAIEDNPPVALPLGRCVDQMTPYEMPPATKVRLLPVEPGGVREVYQVPTLDRMVQTFTETLTYQWVASAGSFSAGTTGGKRDITGNAPALFTDFKSPSVKDLMGEPMDISVWIVQRDERLGLHWYESCIRVVP